MKARPLHGPKNMRPHCTTTHDLHGCSHTPHFATPQRHVHPTDMTPWYERLNAAVSRGRQRDPRFDIMLLEASMKPIAGGDNTRISGNRRIQATGGDRRPDRGRKSLPRRRRLAALHQPWPALALGGGTGDVVVADQLASTCQVNPRASPVGTRPKIKAKPAGRLQLAAERLGHHSRWSRLRKGSGHRARRRPSSAVKRTLFRRPHAPHRIAASAVARLSAPALDLLRGCEPLIRAAAAKTVRRCSRAAAAEHRALLIGVARHVQRLDELGRRTMGLSRTRPLPMAISPSTSTCSAGRPRLLTAPRRSTASAPSVDQGRDR